MEYRTCNKCEGSMPLTKEYFQYHFRQAKVISGFKKVCKVCVNKAQKEYRLKKKLQPYDTDSPEYMIMSPHKSQTDKLMYKALSIIYANAYKQVLTREKFDKLELDK